MDRVSSTKVDGWRYPINMLYGFDRSGKEYDMFVRALLRINQIIISYAVGAYNRVFASIFKIYTRWTDKTE
jgi:hypothetical protein